MLTIDANVFVSAYQRKEVQHPDSDLFLKRAVQQARQFHCPTMLLPETAASIIRPTGNFLSAQRAVAQIQHFPRMFLVALTDVRAAQSAQITVLYRLRGPDAVYVAVAQEFGTTLITWDGEMLQRAPAAVPTMTPTDWLAANPV